MSQRSAVWNLVIQLLPAFGLVLFLVPAARFAPAQFFGVSAALYAVGFGLFLAAKASVVRQGRYTSWGNKGMSPGNRRAYRAGYVLMLLATIGASIFVVVWF